MTSTDPRAAGFNYGAALPEPTSDSYLRVKHLADRYRQRDSEAAREKSWVLDMLIRNVRLSCSPYEQRLALASLFDMAGDMFGQEAVGAEA